MERAIRAFISACSLSHDYGCTQLDDMAAGSADEQVILRLLTLTCTLGSTEGCAKLWSFVNGQASNPQKERSSGPQFVMITQALSVPVPISPLSLQSGTGGSTDKATALALYDKDCTWSAQRCLRRALCLGR